MREQRYRLLILGNLDLTSLDANAGFSLRKADKPVGSTSAVARAATHVDASVINLESTLVAPGTRLRSRRSSANRLPRVDPDDGIAKLKALGVTGANLANDHALDFGETGLQMTSRALKQAGITPFGVGTSAENAAAPLHIPLPDAVGGGKLAFYGAFQYSRLYDRLGFYADDSSAGSAPISAATVSGPLIEELSPDVFHVAFPHWGTGQMWRTYEQYQIAHRLLRKGYHLILGHGSPTVQEIERQLQRWVFYGIGDGDATGPLSGANSGPHQDALPFSSITILEVAMTASGERSLSLKLYPMSKADPEHATNAELVSEAQFRQVMDTIAGRATNGWRFNNPAQTFGKDEIGHFLCFQLGAWPENQPPHPLPPLAAHSDPGDWTIRTAPSELLDTFLDLDKISMGASMYAVQAAKHGGQVDWLTARHAKISCGDKRFIAYGYVANESALGVSICANKVLTAQFLMNAGVQTPKTTPVSAPDEAVEAAREMGGPVVVKPSDGKKSRGVTTNLRDEPSVRRAFHHALDHGSQVLVQQYVETEEEVRVIATPEASIAVIKRVLPHVIGDGVSSIKQLIEDKNLQRELNPSMRKRPIPLDSATVKHLEHQGLSLGDVPDRETWITVRNVAGLSAGADPHEAFETTDQKVKDTAAKAVAAIPGLGWGGVDVIIEKNTGEPFVVEINTDAGYGQALFPTYGKSRNVAEIAWNTRCKTTPRAPRGPTRSPSLHETAQPALLKRSANARGYSRALLSTAFRNFLDHSSYEHNDLSPRVARITLSDGRTVHVTREMMTSNDRSAAVRVVRHHSMVRKLLSLDGLDQPRGRTVFSSRALHKFTESNPYKVVLTPPLGGWMSTASEMLTLAEAKKRASIRPGTYVQAYRRGIRIRVLATQYAALAVITTQRERIEGETIASSSELAVQAVRAVPELRWATAHILVLPSGQCLVEGLSLNPRFTARDVVTAGDLDDFFTWILEGDRRLLDTDAS